MARWKKILILLLILLVAAAAALWLARSLLAQRLLMQMLAEQGVEVKSLVVEQVDPRHAVLRDVVMGAGDEVHIKRLEIDAPGGLQTMAHGTWQAKAKGVQLKARLQKGQLVLGGLEKAWLKAPLADDPNALDIVLDADADMSRDAAKHVSLELQASQLVLRQRQKNLLPPLSMNAQATLSATGGLNAQGKFADARNSLRGNALVRYDMQTSSGIIEWHTEPMKFSQQGLTFAQLSPAMADGVDTIASTMALSGKAELLRTGWVVTPTLAIFDLPVDTLLQQALGAGAAVKGSVKGAVPVRINQNGTWRIQPSRLVNIGPIGVRIDPAATSGALDAHPQAELVRTALSNLEVETLTLDVASTDDTGGVRLKWRFLGRNPDLMGGKKVDLTLAVTVNLQDMWRSIQQVKRATIEVKQQLRKNKP